MGSSMCVLKTHVPSFCISLSISLCSSALSGKHKSYWISIRQMWSPVIGCSCCSPQSFLYNLIFVIVSFPACFPPGLAFDLAGELGGRSGLKCIDGYLILHQSLRRGIHVLPILLRGGLETNCSSSLSSLAALMPVAKFQLWKSRLALRKTNKGNVLLACILK